MPLPSIAPEHGKIPDDPHALRQVARAALKEKDYLRARRMLTVACDLLSNKPKSKASDAKSTASLLTVDGESKGLLHEMLSDRSFANYQLGDFDAAAFDAETCIQAAPGFIPGHLRLIAALAAGNEPCKSVTARAKAVHRGLRACPGARALLLAERALANEPGGKAALELLAAGNQETVAEQMALTRKIADDPKDPRRALAAGDLGSAFAVGAHGLTKNAGLAEKYLKLSADLGDVGGLFNYGMLLLQKNRPAEASQHLRRAADLGSDRAMDTLRQLGAEAEAKREAAMGKLRAMAAKGDARAVALLAKLDAEAVAAAASS